jgi:hypothetical protein
MPRGGKREGTGPKPTGRKKIQFYITEDEHIKLKVYLALLRSDKNSDERHPTE